MHNYVLSAKRTIKKEYDALEYLRQSIDGSFIEACDLILNVEGRTVVTGMGKSGHVAKKISATLSSTGTPSFFLHPAEANHGDLGALSEGDLLIAISNSGSTSEIISFLPSLKRLGVPIISICGDKSSELATYSDVNLDILGLDEACPLNLAPTTSTTMSLVLGDAIAIALLEARGFSEKDFSLSHPVGALGRKLTLTVAELMYTLDQIPKVLAHQTIRDGILEMNLKGLGMTLVVSQNNVLLGIFTDGDLRRAIDSEYHLKSTQIEKVMSKKPKIISSDTLASDALRIMHQSKITSLVVSENEQISGVVHLHDILKTGLKK
jgi:arabinose-5-phosphate isomerase